jgi:hypothetical protein
MVGPVTCLSCLTRATASSRLPAHQREVLVAIALSDAPIDVLAERLNTTRGAALAARGLGVDGDERGEER